jgi:hypothetical protein
MNLSVLHSCLPLPPGRFLVINSVRGWVGPRAIVRLEGLSQLKNPVTSLEIESVTFWLVAQCLNKLHCCVPLSENFRLCKPEGPYVYLWNPIWGCAIPQVVSCRLLTTAAHVRSCEICGGQSGVIGVLSQYFGFLCRFSFHRLLHTDNHLSSGAGTIGQTVPGIPTGPDLTPPQIKQRHNLSYQRTCMYICNLTQDLLTTAKKGLSNLCTQTMPNKANSE